MTRTVELVILGADAAARAAAVDGARRGLRVLVVIRSRRACVVRRLRRSLRAAGSDVERQITVMIGAEVVCVGGIHSVEAVVVRRLSTRQLIGFNVSAIFQKV